MSLLETTKGQDFYYDPKNRLNWFLKITKSQPTDVVPNATSAWRVRICRPNYTDDIIINGATSPALSVTDIADGVDMAVIFEQDNPAALVDAARLPRGTRIFAEVDNVEGHDSYFWQNLAQDPSKG